MSFVHLHNHSHYSLLDGAQNIKEMLKKVKKCNMPAIALTDHGNLFGAIEFYEYAKKEAIKPIIGMEAYIVGQGNMQDKAKRDKDNLETRSYHLVLLCKNNKGYQNLCKLSSLSFTEGFYYKPRIDKKILKKYSEGLIGLTACLGGEVTNAHLKGDHEYANQAIDDYLDIFGEENFYLEIQRHGQKEDFAYMINYEVAKKRNLRYVVTNDCHYTEKEHWTTHDILICMQAGMKKNDTNRKMHYAPEEFYLRSAEEMRQLFHDMPEACDATLEIADRCDLYFDFKSYYLPKFPIPEDEGQIDADEFLKRKAERGLLKRYSEINDSLNERLNYELAVIKKMGFSSYFLVVLDFIEEARRLDIPVGLGRGSAAGSLVAFATGITSVDPIRYDLLFERFLNPERISMPDVDIDFCMRRREEVINYVRKKYGEDNVCQIITFGTLASKNAVKDVARVLDISFDKANEITKLIPVVQGKPKSVEEAFLTIPELLALLESDDPIYKELYQHAKVLEGAAKSTGIHAAGVIIAPEDVSNLIPIYKNQDGTITTQYAMKYAEQVGLLKMDFLGLRTLTVIDDATKMIRKLSDKTADFDVVNIPMDDSKTFELYSHGNTVGVFQFESSGMQEYLRKLKPSRIEDLIAMNALYRPGPMDMIPEFIDRKHGRKKVEYLHPMLESILSETYGIIIYQEQVMKIVADLGGFTLGEADTVRRAMGKKQKDIMDAFKEKFILQAKEIHKIDEKISTEIYDLIVKFASYGFNKSHSAAYSILSYQTAYLKAHFPAQFMASIMSSEIESPDRITVYMEECKKLKLKVIPPDINVSFPDFSAPDNKTIAFGMQAIKNVGLIALQSIVEARVREGNYTNFFQLIERVDSRVVNKKVLEALIQSGAMDSIEGNRRQKFESIDIATEFSQKLQLNKVNENQTSIFSADLVDEIKISYPILTEIDEWPLIEKLKREKELLGFYVSGHPLKKFEQDIKYINSINLIEADPKKVQQLDGRLAGLINDVSLRTTKRMEKMAILRVENFDAGFEVVVFPKVYQKIQSALVVGSMLVFHGKITMDEEERSVKMIADDAMPLEEGLNLHINSLTIKVDLISMERNHYQQLQQILQKEIGDVPVFFEIISEKYNEIIRLRSSKFRINGHRKTIENLTNLMGESSLIIN